MKFTLVSIGDNVQSARTNEEFYKEMLEQVTLAEELGFDEYWVAEHHFSDYGLVPNPANLLSAMAVRTSKIRLGSGVSILPYRDPLQVAEEYAMVDVISNGRLNFGAGRGFLVHEYERYGLDSQEKSRGLFNEALDIILKAWEGQPFTYDGKYHQVKHETKLQITPVQKPLPNVHIAALSPQSFEAAARRGFGISGVIVSVQQFEAVKGIIDNYKKVYAETQGKSAEGMEFPFVFYTAVTNKGKEYEEGGRYLEYYFRFLANFFNPAQVAHMDPGTVGFYTQMHNYCKTVTFEQIQQQTDMAVIGDPEHVIEKIKKMESIGVTMMGQHYNFGNMPRERVMDSMRLFAREVMPAFRN